MLYFEEVNNHFPLFKLYTYVEIKNNWCQAYVCYSRVRSGIFFLYWKNFWRLIIHVLVLLPFVHTRTDSLSIFKMIISGCSRRNLKSLSPASLPNHPILRSSSGRVVLLFTFSDVASLCVQVAILLGGEGVALPNIAVIFIYAALICSFEFFKVLNGTSMYQVPFHAEKIMFLCYLFWLFF